MRKRDFDEYIDRYRYGPLHAALDGKTVSDNAIKICLSDRDCCGIHRDIAYELLEMTEEERLELLR